MLSVTSKHMMLSVVLQFYYSDCCYADSGGGEKKECMRLNWIQDTQYNGILHNDISA
jgi:hypothetical protein